MEEETTSGRQELRIQPRPEGLRLDTRYFGQTVVAMAARPGELEPYIGGTLARLSRGGARVVMAVVGVPRTLRRALDEAQQAAATLGCEFQVLVGDRCSRVEDLKSYQLVSRIDALVRDLQPVCVMTHGDCGFDEDHGILYNACLSSNRVGGFDMFCYYPQAGSVLPALYFPRAFVDITETFDLKRDAVHAYAQPILDQDELREVARAHGLKSGFTYAEEFDVIRLMLR